MRFKVQSSKFRVACVLVMVTLFGCQPEKEIAKVEEVIPVKVSRVRLTKISEALEYVGNIKAKDEVIVYPKVSGKISEKIKEDGSFIAKGEAIAYIDRDEVGLKFEKAPVDSPLTGIVGRVFVDIGSNVSSLTPVALVVNMDEVKINLDIPEKFLSKVSLGQAAKVLVDAYPEQEFSGTVTKISPVVDLNTRSSPLEITVSNAKHLLKSGMFARVQLVIEERENVPVVLKEAITGKEPDLYVYVIENKKAVLRKVSLGLRQGPYYEAREGLREGDPVVIMGQQRLYEGAIVELEE